MVILKSIALLFISVLCHMIAAGSSFAGEISSITSGGETLYYVGTGSPAINVNPSTINFGTVAVGSLTTRTITVTNTGAGTLLVGAVNSPSPPYSITTNCSGQSLSQNGTCTITVTFAPATTGRISINLTIPSNDPTNPAFNVSVTGIANGATISVTPNPLDFGSVGVGRTTTRMVTVQNTGSANLVLGALDGPGFPFAKTGGTCANTTTLVANQTCTITLQFTPTGPGNFNGSFEIISNATNASLVTVSLTSASSALPQITLTPNPLNFGMRPVGSIGTSTILIGNGGTADLILGSPPVSVVTSPFSIASSTCTPGLSLTSGATCGVTITFAPLTIGTFSGSFNISSNTGNAPGTQTPVTLFGSASPPLPSCSASFTPANVNVGQTTSLAWTSANNADGQIPYTCTGNLGNGTLTSPTGSIPVSPNATQTCTFNVDNGLGNTNTCSATVSIGAQPSSCTASFAPSNVGVGQTSILSWTSSNDSDGQIPYACNGNLGSGIFNSPNGGATVSPTTTQTCTLTVDNGSGSVNTCAATIAVDGAASCSASFSPASIMSGQSSTLSWSSSNASNGQIPYTCTGNLGSGIFTTSSSSATVSPTATQTCTLTTDSGTGSITTCSATITVGASGTTTDPTCTASFSPSSVGVSQPSTLTWSSANNADGQIQYNCTGNLSSGILSETSGSMNFSPDTTQTCIFSVANAAGTSNTCSATITVNACGQISASPTAIDFGIVAAGGFETQTVTVTNTGAGPLTLTAASLPSAPFFIDTGGTCSNGTVLAPNTTCTINLKVAPLGPGTFNGSFSIANDSQCMSQSTTINLTDMAITTQGYTSGLYVMYYSTASEENTSDIWASPWLDAYESGPAANPFCTGAANFNLQPIYSPGAGYLLANLGGGTLNLYIDTSYSRPPICNWGATFATGTFYVSGQTNNCPFYWSATLPPNSACVFFSNVIGRASGSQFWGIGIATTTPLMNGLYTSDAVSGADHLCIWFPGLYAYAYPNCP